MASRGDPVSDWLLGTGKKLRAARCLLTAIGRAANDWRFFDGVDLNQQRSQNKVLAVVRNGRNPEKTLSTREKQKSLSQKQTMNKILNKWFRKTHRWLAVPTALLIPMAVVIRISGNPSWQAFLKSFEMAQSLLMLVLAITGAYLFLLPYLTKWQRENTRSA